jgi:hypothetical protein
VLPLAFVLGIALPPQGTPAPAARIEGTVVDALCAAVADAEVIALVQGREVARGRSDGSGAFALADLPHEVVIVRARGKGLAFAVARVDLTGDDFAAPRLQCFASRTLTGRVLADDKPAAGAQVIAEPDDLPEFVDAPPCAVTGADGSYRLEGVVVGPARVRVWGPGLPLAEKASEGPGDATVDFALSPRDARELIVRVHGASPAQLASTRVTLAAVANGERTALPPGLTCGTPDAEGNVRFPGYPARLFVTHVMVAVPGAVTEPWRGEGDVTAEFHVAAAASRLLRGVVHDPRGRPLAHRQVLLRPFDDPPWSFSVVRGETGDDGAFALVCPVSKGVKFALRLVDEEWVVQQGRTWRPDAWFVDAFDPAAVLSVAAVPALSLHATLCAPDGAPLRGAEVTVLGGAGPRFIELGSGTSRSDGSVDIVGLNAHGVAPSLRVESPTWLVPQRPIPDAAELGADLTRSMVRAGSIAGRTMDGAAPLPGVRVRLGERLTVTDVDGRFRFDGVPPGGAELTMNHRPGRREVEVRAGEETTVEQR